MEEQTAPQSAEVEQPESDRASLAIAGAALVVIVSVIIVVWALMRTQMPGENSAEAGFARDMMEHHDQGVEISLIIRDRTEFEDLRFVAIDMALTQQAQIGQMRGWLDIWGLHPAHDGTRMAWMGHPTTDRMPGMATPEQIQQMRELPVPEAEDLFLEVMILHHQSGIEMSDAVLELTDNEAVLALAESISRVQEAEIENMQRLRERLGLERVEVVPQIHADHDQHDHD